MTSRSKQRAGGGSSPKPGLERISVAKKKGCVDLEDIGHEPLTVISTIRGPALITDGYKAYSFSDGETWIGETKLVPDAPPDVLQPYEAVPVQYKPLYRFTSQSNPSIFSSWQPSPTEAYREVFAKFNPKEKRVGNGQLILGLTYPNLQERAIAAHPHAANLLKNFANSCTEGKPRSKTSARVPTRYRSKRNAADSTNQKACSKRISFSDLEDGCSETRSRIIQSSADLASDSGTDADSDSVRTTVSRSLRSPKASQDVKQSVNVSALTLPVIPSALLDELEQVFFPLIDEQENCSVSELEIEQELSYMNIPSFSPRASAPSPSPILEFLDDIIRAGL